MPRPRKLPSLRLFLSLALGVLAVWVVAAMFALMQAQSRMSNGITYYETLGVDTTGTLVIDSYSTAGGVYRPLPRRYVDGKDVGGKDAKSPLHPIVRQATLAAGPSRRGWFDGPIDWTQRLMSSRTEGRATWYLVRNDAPAGRAYIVGFDRESRLPTRYAGRNGFCPTLPEAARQFEVGGPFGYASQRVVGVAWNGGRYFSLGSNTDVSPTPRMTLFLLDGDDLVEIDVLSSSLRTIMKTTDAISLAIVEQPIAEDAIDARHMTSVDGVFTLQTPMVTRLALRTGTSIVIIDPQEPSQVEFNLPDDLQAADFDLYSLGPEQILVDRAERDNQGKVEHHLTWIKADNGAVRTETVTTRGNSLQNMMLESLLAAAVMPTLALFAPLGLMFMPSTLLQTGAAANLEDALWQTASAIWPAALGLAIFSLVVAWLVLRWERKHGRPHPWRWAVATFFLGLPGFIAYVILYGRKSLAASRREAPAAPTLLGTELFS